MKLYLPLQSIVATVIIVSALILILLNSSCTYVDVATDEVQITITGEQGR
jgi:hypothetical protein